MGRIQNTLEKAELKMSESFCSNRIFSDYEKLTLSEVH